MAEIKCSGCNIGLIGEDFVEFNCPSCGKGKILRCKVCRKGARKYSCSECGFVGP